jgi:hypothetical protein
MRSHRDAYTASFVRLHVQSKLHISTDHQPSSHLTNHLTTSHLTHVFLCPREHRPVSCTFSRPPELRFVQNSKSFLPKPLRWCMHILCKDFSRQFSVTSSEEHTPGLSNRPHVCAGSPIRRCRVTIILAQATEDEGIRELSKLSSEIRLATLQHTHTTPNSISMVTWAGALQLSR